MLSYQLPDGRWATTPVYIGIGDPPPLCAETEHDWQTRRSGEIPGRGAVLLEQCTKCRYFRSIHPPPTEEELVAAIVPKTADGIGLRPGMQVWLYPADSVTGGTIEPRTVGALVNEHKFLYPAPASDGTIGARAKSTYSTREAAEAQRAKDLLEDG